MANRLNFLKNGRVYASVKACVAETTLTFVRERDFDRERNLYRYAVEAPSNIRFFARHGALPSWISNALFNGDSAAKEAAKLDGNVTYDALRLKKARARKNACTIVGLHGDRVRFITITCRENILSKKEFLYQLENLRKELARLGYVLKYSGMLERQKRGAWHLHALCYLPNDGDWNYKEIQRVAVRRGFNIDMRELRNKCNRTTKKISGYMLKLDAVIAAAYAAKMENGEDYCYTLTSKGCDIPKDFKIYDPAKAREFIVGYGFRKQETEIGGNVFIHYLLESEAFGRDIYDSC